jgi:alpha-tubulin suppressor-like RCC1 family protein
MWSLCLGMMMVKADINIGSNESGSGRPVMVSLDVIDESDVSEVTWEMPWLLLDGEICVNPGTCDGGSQIGIGNFSCESESHEGIVYRGQDQLVLKYPPDSLVNFTQVSAGEAHTCAILSNGSAICWGLNDNDRTEVPTLDSGVNFTQVSAGYQHSCAILSNGSAICWGNGGDHQTDVPTLDLDVNFTQVSAGFYHTCAVLSNGSAICWGLNDNDRTEVPILDSGVNFTQVSAGGSHTCAILSNGSASSWG